MLNGIDIRVRDITEVRDVCGLVSQEPFMLNSSIADSIFFFPLQLFAGSSLLSVSVFIFQFFCDDIVYIKYGTRRNHSIEDVSSAASSANAHEFIDKLPEVHPPW